MSGITSLCQRDDADAASAAAETEARPWKRVSVEVITMPAVGNAVLEVVVV